MKCIGRGKKKTIKKHSGELPKREWKGVLALQAVTVTPREEAATIGQREQQRVISSRLVLRWEENRQLTSRRGPMVPTWFRGS